MLDLPQVPDLSNKNKSAGKKNDVPWVKVEPNNEHCVNIEINFNDINDHFLASVS